ncbi:MAG TPA: YMGG-like glycine zipper-containing protein [Anaeromyxobacteraceae bacterium]|nr:YMGG-like glycine zipper-containing protein [Anaeromyxobacteraceae bacterium]
MRRLLAIAFLASGCATVETVPAEQPFPPPPPPTPPPSYAAWLGMAAYPAQGQPPEQQRDDDYACYLWARQETRIDPGAPPPAPPPTAAPGSGVATGAATGAVAGAVLGGVFGHNPVGGAVVGAMTGAVAGAAAEQQAQAQAAQAAGQAQQARLDVFRRGFAACMEGRGYTVR